LYLGIEKDSFIVLRPLWILQVHI